MKVRDILKAIHKLNPGDRHRLRAHLIDALTASFVTGNVLQEISERKNKEGYHCPHCESEHIVQNGKYTSLVDVKKLKSNGIFVKLAKRHLLILQIPLCTELVV